MHKKPHNKKGFLLVELIVSIFIFGVVMTISVGSLVMALDANKKTQSLKSVLNNLNVVLETMTKSLATGKYFYCDSDGVVDMPHDDVSNCEGEQVIAFAAGEDLGGESEQNQLSDDAVVYRFVQSSGDEGGYLARTQYFNGSITNVSGEVRLTAPEVNISDVRFYVTGTDPDDTDQPKVLIVIEGESTSGPRNLPTRFVVQTQVTQLVPDF